MSTPKKKKKNLAVVDTPVRVRGHRGVVRFVGECEFGEGEWIGVDLIEAVGKNNGTVSGVSYFTCEPKHGVFVRKKMLKKDAPDTPGNGSSPQDSPQVAAMTPTSKKMMPNESPVTASPTAIPLDPISPATLDEESPDEEQSAGPAPAPIQSPTGHRPTAVFDHGEEAPPVAVSDVVVDEAVPAAETVPADTPAPAPAPSPSISPRPTEEPPVQQPAPSQATSTSVRRPSIQEMKEKASAELSYRGPMYLIFAVFLATSIVLIWWLAANPFVPEVPEVPVPATGSAKFAWDLYGNLVGAKTASENIVVSPYSVSSALLMTLLGAEGETAVQMADVLNVQDDVSTQQKALRDVLSLTSENETTLRIANRLWGKEDYPWSPEYLANVSAYFLGGFQPTNFTVPEEARVLINQWVADQTQGLIPELLSEGILSPLARLVLTNALYFYGNWTDQFEESNTADAVFTTLEGSEVTVPFMNRRGQYKYLKDADTKLTLLQMPYLNERFSLIVVLPDEKAGLSDVETTMANSPGTIDSLIGSLLEQDVAAGEVALKLPKFHVRSEFSLKTALMALGMKDAFDGDLADFSGMVTTPTSELYVSNVIHEAVIDVFEAGTEAAAATAVVMYATGMPPEPDLTFSADHPFVYVLYDAQTATHLFLGRLVDPSIVD